MKFCRSPGTINQVSRAPAGTDCLDLQGRIGKMAGSAGPERVCKTTATRIQCGVILPTSGQIQDRGFKLPWHEKKHANN